MNSGRKTYIDRQSQRPPRLNDRSRWAVKSLVRVLLVVAFVVAYFVYVHLRKTHQEPEQALPANELLMVKLPSNVPSQEIDYTGFHVSFNESHHVPNYVSWELTRAEAAGKGERVNRFDIDPAVKGCANLDDYRRSGYDRGHMAPAGDMKWNEKAMVECHYLSNIVPQDHGVNEGVWNTLEKLTREWVALEDSLIIISGPILTDECPVKIGPSQVTVPERFFKIIFAPHAKPPMALAFIVPNSMPTEQYEWYSVSIDEIEELTGMDFFASLPDELENQIEKSRGLGPWKNHMRIKRRELRNIQQH